LKTNETCLPLKQTSVGPFFKSTLAEIYFIIYNPAKDQNMEAIDLGLSVKWSNANLGAQAPTDHGHYYAWGEKERKNIYDWMTYKWCHGGVAPQRALKLIKYNTRNFNRISGVISYVDNRDVLMPSDDVANIMLGGSYRLGVDWCIPTAEQWKELIDRCSWEWVSLNGFYGYNVISRSNGNCIFIPAAGLITGMAPFTEHNEGGRYFTSSLYPDDPLCAYCVSFDNRGVQLNPIYRYFGLSIRPVLDPSFVKRFDDYESRFDY